MNSQQSAGKIIGGTPFEHTILRFSIAANFYPSGIRGQVQKGAGIVIRGRRACSGHLREAWQLLTYSN
jgi:hypothetical protein